MLRLAPGRLLNAQLRLLSWLGEELHGESFLAELRPQGKIVTVKVMRADPCRTPAYHERFRRTAELALALSHRHAAAVHAFGVLQDPGEARGKPQQPGFPWIAMDYVEGQDLRAYLIDGMPIGALAELLLPVGDLLDRAAEIGLAHGEIAPWNITLCPDAAGLRAVVLDLGLAKVVGDHPLDVPVTPAMLAYYSPEQCAPQGMPEPASDRYALATILYEGVAGRPPFQSADSHEVLRAHRVAPVPPLRALVPSLHRAPALDAFFVRALAKQPQARFPSATAMLEEFLLALNLPQGARGGLQARRRSARWYRIRRRDGEAAMNVVVGPRAVLGKQPECDVVCHALPSPEHDVVTAGVSREHAVLIWLDDRLSVLDQSVNGTYVNGRRASSRLTPVPDGGVLRLGEHLALSVSLLGSPGPSDGEERTGALLVRRDGYAAGVAPTLMLWQRMALEGSPLAALGGAMAHGHVWVAQRELWWGGHPRIAWERQDGGRVIGPAPLRHGDLLSGDGAVLVVEH